MQTAQFQLHAEIEERHWWFVARRRIMRTLVNELLPSDPRATVIDVGCGTGANLAALVDDYRCVGIDTSAEAVELARRRFPRGEFLHGFAPADLGPLAAEARVFLLMDVLEHVADDFAVLSELLAAATPGSYFLITVPADMRLWSPHDESFGHYRRYDRSRFVRLWEGLPVTPLAVSHFNTRLYPVIRLLRTWNRRRERTSGAASTDFHLPSTLVNSVLEGVFAGEARRLVDLLRGRRTAAYTRGVSQLAILRRETGAIAPRTKPADIAADPFDPPSR